jgi:hypothetical protein
MQYTKKPGKNSSDFKPKTYSSRKPAEIDENAVLKAKARYVRGLNAIYGYLVPRPDFTISQLFPAIFVCKNLKCNADYRVNNFQSYSMIKRDPICCCCGYPLLQFLLKDETDI